MTDRQIADLCNASDAVMFAHADLENVVLELDEESPEYEAFWKLSQLVSIAIDLLQERVNPLRSATESDVAGGPAKD